MLCPAVKRWGPNGRGYVAHVPFRGPPLILSPAVKHWEPPRRQGLCSRSTHLWATSDLALRRHAWRPPRSHGLCSPSAHLWAIAHVVPRRQGKGYVANPPTFGPFLILSPVVKRWGPPRHKGLCSPSAHLWATAHVVTRSKALGTPHAAKVMQPIHPLVGHGSCCPPL